MDNIKELLTESTKGLLSEETVNKLIEMNEKYVEDQLMEAAEKFAEKENKLNNEISELKESFINWCDTIAEEICEIEMKKTALTEMNKDMVTFHKMVNEMSKKYMSEEDPDDEMEKKSEESEDEEIEKIKKATDKLSSIQKKEKKSEMNEQEDDEECEDKKMKKNKMAYTEKKKTEDEEDNTEEETNDSEVSDMQEQIETLKKEKNDLIKKGLIAEKITHNTTLSEKQKDELSEICEGAEFDGNIDNYLAFINQEVELVLAGNDSISKSGMSDDPTIVKESTEEKEIILESTDKNNKVKKVKKVFKNFNIQTKNEINIKSSSAKLI